MPDRETQHGDDYAEWRGDGIAWGDDVEWGGYRNQAPSDIVSAADPDGAERSLHSLSCIANVRTVCSGNGVGMRSGMRTPGHFGSTAALSDFGTGLTMGCAVFQLPFSYR